MPDPAPVRRTFGPVVLVGLASAALAAVAAAKPWIGSGATTTRASDATMTALDSGTHYPLASAVSLVLLASWGVLLVTRGSVRRAFAFLAALAAVALVASVVAGYVTLPDATGDSYDELMGRGSGERGFTGWFWTSAVSAVVALVPAVLAVRLVRQWPEMGSRYDAPGDVVTDGGSDPDRELWRALDEGHDPTDTTRPVGNLDPDGPG